MILGKYKAEWMGKAWCVNSRDGKETFHCRVDPLHHHRYILTHIRGDSLREYRFEERELELLKTLLNYVDEIEVSDENM